MPESSSYLPGVDQPVQANLNIVHFDYIRLGSWVESEVAGFSVLTQ